MQKYDKNVLRDNLRNGMIHNEVPKASHYNFAIFTTFGFFTSININDFYEDFSKACDVIISKLKAYEQSEPGSLVKKKKFPRIIVQNM